MKGVKRNIKRCAHTDVQAQTCTYGCACRDVHSQMCTGNHIHPPTLHTASLGSPKQNLMTLKTVSGPIQFRSQIFVC